MTLPVSAILNDPIVALQKKVDALQAVIDKLTQNIQVGPFGLLIQSQGAIEIKAGGGLTLFAQGDLTIEAKANLRTIVMQDYIVTVSAGNASLSCGANYNLTISGAANSTVSGNYYLGSRGTFTVVGADLSLGGNRVGLNGITAVLTNRQPTIGTL
jgi:hypothetical protein